MCNRWVDAGGGGFKNGLINHAPEGALNSRVRLVVAPVDL
jgi:hypothetical protein